MLKKLEELLRTEVEKIERPFGLFLSGGIDSGLLAALSKPDFAITCNFPMGEKYDELEYAKLIAKYLKIDLTVLKIKKQYFLDNIAKAVKIIGKPINSVSIIPWYGMMEVCQGKNMVNGEGADEIFGGYSRYLILKHILELYKVPELENYHITLDFLFNNLHSQLVETEMPPLKDIETVMRAEYKKTLPDIFYMEERLAEHFQIKLYQPYRAKAIREFADKLPLEEKIDGWMTKVILRKLAQSYLPRRVWRRADKKGLVCPVNRWMGWSGRRKEFDKEEYIKYQKSLLK